MEKSESDLRQQKLLDKKAKRDTNVKKARELRTKGMSHAAIGQVLGLGESSVRALLKSTNN